MGRDTPRKIHERFTTGDYSQVPVDLGITGTDIDGLRTLDRERAKKIGRIAGCYNMEVFVAHASWPLPNPIGPYAEAYIQKISGSALKGVMSNNLGALQEFALGLAPQLELWVNDERVPAQLP